MTTSFIDVEAGAWYESAAHDLVEMGALDSTQKLRPNDLATRAEMVELLVRLRKQALQYPARSSFDDVSINARFSPYIETAARVGWLRGDRNCYGTHPCTARPNDGVNRAEAATLLMRVFSLPANNLAPDFFDNAHKNAWYYQAIQTAADHCVLQGDDFTHLVRPSWGMNRAEMIVMFDRASKNLIYGTNCGVTPVQNNISSAEALSATRVRLTFSSDVDAVRANDAFRYTISTAGGVRINSTDATLIGNRTVDLTLETSLTNQTLYRVNVSELRTASGIIFSADTSFLFSTPSARISSVVALSSTRVRLQFDTDIQANTGDDAYRYTVREAGTNSFIGVNAATIVNSRTVDLILSAAVRTQVSYVVSVNDLVTQNGIRFNDSATFNFSESNPDVSSISPVNATTLRLTFATNLDEVTAENVTHYRVSSNNRDLVVTNARLVSDHLIDLTLGENMESQRVYTVTVTDLRTSGGVLFSDSASTLYIGANSPFTATLIGAREVPPVTISLSGTGSFTLSSAGLAYTISLMNLSGSIITAAHFHRGATGVNGPAIQTISFTGSQAIGTWAGLTEQDRNDLFSGNIYVNVHTQAYPNGAIRGQVITQ